MERYSNDKIRELIRLIDEECRTRAMTEERPEIRPNRAARFWANLIGYLDAGTRKKAEQICMKAKRGEPQDADVQAKFQHILGSARKLNPELTQEIMSR